MLNMKEYSHIRKLKQSSLSIKSLVDRTGYARNTIRKVLRSEADKSSYNLSRALSGDGGRKAAERIKIDADLEGD